ncbi:hypothetical protein IE077_002014 [Cardiosporidium cionae]|uniref:t-SNARE coiled-coil homology domain-containing protein n=1 Tax=Cardiosporidium cionae TaxID=476202 RepID=A0ABQ7J4M4_9APIC|nr:hypothetical protein IE077_002014 [Cardiosporidium cionae]|eukprot:KAF8818527.1 hypothetical protein IE077_002014 [Cardiosporidium cionae]
MKNSKVNSIEALIQRSAFIEEQCLPKENTEEKETKNDAFLRIKKNTVDLIRNCRVLIQDRHRIQRTKGNSFEAIKKGKDINQIIEQLHGDFRGLSNAYTKQCKRRDKEKFSDEELQRRYDEIGVIKRQIDELVSSYKSTNGLFDFSENGDEIEKELGLTNSLNLESNRWRGRPEEKVSEEDQATLSKWKERDAHFDQQVVEIGKSVEAIAEEAYQIKDRTEKQISLAADIQEKVVDTSAELRFVNDRIKGVVEKGNSGKYCFRFVLIFVVIIMAVALASVSIRKFA